MINSSELLILLNQQHGKSYGDGLKMTIQTNGKLGDRVNEISIHLEQMYQHIDFDFEFLLKISDLLKTKKIDIGDKYSSEGCETCNYGSSYSCTLNIAKTIPIYLDAFSWFPNKYHVDLEKPAVMMNAEFGKDAKVDPRFKKAWDRVYPPRNEQVTDEEKNEGWND